MPEELGFFQHSREKRRQEVIARLAPREGVRTVLDAGAASGWLAETLARRGFRVSALDLGLDSIRRAKERLRTRGVRVDFLQGDIYRLPFAEGGLDAVTASEILEHLEDPPAALREVARVVRPGGTVVLCTPYRERIETTLCIHCNQKTPVNAHLHSFSENDLTLLLNEAGFRVERIVRFLSRPAERFGLSGLTVHLPFSLWRAADAFACRVLKRECYIAVKAVRNA